MTECSVDGCDRKSTARQLCGRHYQRWTKHGDALANHARRRGTCSIDECETSSEAKGLCGRHYQRLLKHGDPLTDHTRRRQPCSVDGCDRLTLALGLCPGHYTRSRDGRPVTDRPLRRYIVTDDLSKRLREYAPPGRPDECWPWTGGLNKGYGVIAVHGSKVRIAHDVAWEIHHQRKLPRGMVIRHTCDNPQCVNPAHLLLGTHGDNCDDKVSRNRQAKGEGHGVSVLTEPEVRSIRALCAAGHTQRSVAGQFGVSQGAISLIVRRKMWAYLE